MVKQEFGSVVRSARQRKGYSLRRLADRVALDYSRLARIEHGRRPPPDLMTIRLLADALDLDLADLVVAAGTSQEVVKHLLWAERLHNAEGSAAWESGLIVPNELRGKNQFRVDVLSREGALCTARLGTTQLRFFDFGSERSVVVEIPPEAVCVWRGGEGGSSTMDNVWALRVKRLRLLGQVVNLVLEGPSFELNAVHNAEAVWRLRMEARDAVCAGVPSTAVRVKRGTEDVR